MNEWSKEIDDRSKKLDVNYRPLKRNLYGGQSHRSGHGPTPHSSSPMDLMVTRVSTASLCSQVGGSGAPLYWPSTFPVA